MPEFKVFVRNSYQAQELKDHMSDILSILRKALQNDDVRCLVEIDETKVEKVAYTPKERLEQMIQKNKSMIDMVQSFDLQFG